MVSPLFFIREVCLFVAKFVQNFFFFLSCRTRGATVKFVQLNAIKLNDPGIIRADNRSSRTSKRRISRVYTYPILRKLCLFKFIFMYFPRDYRAKYFFNLKGTAHRLIWTGIVTSS